MSDFHLLLGHSLLTSSAQGVWGCWRLAGSRGPLTQTGEAVAGGWEKPRPGSVAHVAPALSPAHPALLLLLGRAARGSSRATLPGAPLPCRELWGTGLAWQGPHGGEWAHPDPKCVPQARPNTWPPWCRPGHPTTPSCSWAIPPTLRSLP